MSSATISQLASLVGILLAGWGAARARSRLERIGWMLEAVGCMAALFLVSIVVETDLPLREFRGLMIGTFAFITGGILLASLGIRRRAQTEST
jgi:hypothetical protein